MDIKEVVKTAILRNSHEWGDEQAEAVLKAINEAGFLVVPAKAQAVPEWISVKNELPPENILVLGMSQTRSNIFNFYDVMALDEFDEADITHWMPLPDAPQEPANEL
ncbi:MULTISPECIES: DUF551 domain-containing protein [unclassified Acinetobacter]|uniref:DUF551 domain-containing protein n=1 Tax=unclassified Acinetobacter TaxID=196816 RepID=UPI0015D2BDAA|nr:MULTISPECIES: DUF551 domain-containing protein [unclassified Acinetobacter]